MPPTSTFAKTYRSVTDQSSPIQANRGCPPWEVLLRRIQWSQACWGHCRPSSSHSSRRIIQPRPGKKDVLNCRHNMLDVASEPCSWLSTAMRVCEGSGGNVSDSGSCRAVLHQGEGSSCTFTALCMHQKHLHTSPSSHQ